MSLSIVAVTLGTSEADSPLPVTRIAAALNSSRTSSWDGSSVSRWMTPLVSGASTSCVWPAKLNAPLLPTSIRARLCSGSTVKARGEAAPAGRSPSQCDRQRRRREETLA